LNKKKLLEKIELALDGIRPYLKADGGDINVVDITEDMTVKVKLLGACGNCNVSTLTLENGVEVAIKRAVPEIKKVIDVTE
tara:strand:- start:518 stop:760 length:243 start_codon:yes stop_codon:yes gene_type:complete